MVVFVKMLLTIFFIRAILSLQAVDKDIIAAFYVIELLILLAYIININ